MALASSFLHLTGHLDSASNPAASELMQVNVLNG